MSCEGCGAILTEYFQEDFKYNVIARFKSDISAYHDPIQGIFCG